MARTARFEVITNGDLQRARALVQDLERFHQVMLSKTTAEERESAPPLKVFLARDRASYRALGAPRESEGMFFSTTRGTFALVDMPRTASSGGMTARHILQHEYVHYMLAISGSHVPSWYNEGLAEYMATTEFNDDGSYTVGKPPLFRTRRLRGVQWIPTRELLDAKNISQLRGYFDSYAQAWYMLHWFSENGERQRQLGQYLRMWRGGASPERAIEGALGMSLAELDAELLRHAQDPRHGYASITPAEPLQVPPVQIVRLNAADAHRVLGDLLVELVGPRRSTMELLKEAQRVAPSDARVHATLARAYLRWVTLRVDAPAELKEERPAGDLLALARDHMEQARKMGGDDPEVLVVEGHVRAVSAERGWNANEAVAREELQQARAAYRKAIRADETLGEAYYGLGSTYLLDDNGSKEAVVVLEAATYLIPRALEVAMALATIERGRGNTLQAIAPLQYVLSWAHEGAMHERASKALDELTYEAAVQMRQQEAKAKPAAEPEPRSAEPPAEVPQASDAEVAPAHD